MSAYIDCPSCGVNAIPPTVTRCGECEIAERYAEQIATLTARCERAEGNLSTCHAEREWAVSSLFTQIATLTSERNAAAVERDAAVRERDEIAGREALRVRALIAERDAALRERDEARAERDAARQLVLNGHVARNDMLRDISAATERAARAEGERDTAREGVASLGAALIMARARLAELRAAAKACSLWATFVPRLHSPQLSRMLDVLREQDAEQVSATPAPPPTLVITDDIRAAVEAVREARKRLHASWGSPMYEARRSDRERAEEVLTTAILAALPPVKP